MGRADPWALSVQERAAPCSHHTLSSLHAALLGNYVRARARTRTRTRTRTHEQSVRHPAPTQPPRTQAAGPAPRRTWPRRSTAPPLGPPAGTAPTGTARPPAAPRCAARPAGAGSPPTAPATPPAPAHASPPGTPRRQPASARRSRRRRRRRRRSGRRSTGGGSRRLGTRCRTCRPAALRGRTAASDREGQSKTAARQGLAAANAAGRRCAGAPRQAVPGPLCPVGRAAAHDVGAALQPSDQVLHGLCARVGPVSETEAPNGEHRPPVVVQICRRARVPSRQAFPILLYICQMAKDKLFRSIQSVETMQAYQKQT